MSLIEEVSKFEQNATKLNTATVNIKNKIKSLGGTAPTNLTGVPRRIQNMIGKYRRFAAGSVVLPYDSIIPTSGTGKVTINYNLGFIPSYIIVDAGEIRNGKNATYEGYLQNPGYILYIKGSDMTNAFGGYSGLITNVTAKSCVVSKIWANSWPSGGGGAKTFKYYAFG